MSRSGYRAITVSVDVDVIMDEFDTKTLLDELVLRDVITEDGAKSLLAGGDRKAIPEPVVDLEELEIATHEWRNKRRDEALRHLERALPRDWRGLAS